MEKAIENSKREFSGVRSGKASPNMLDTIKVEVYGSLLPLNQVASIAAPEPRIILVTPFDKAQAKVIEKAIRDSDLGLDPAHQSGVIRVPLPSMNEQRRKEMVKVAHKYAEEAKVAVRHVRRDGIDVVKKLEKDGDMTKDDAARNSDLVQKATDQHIAEIDQALAAKEKEILHV